MPTANEKLAKLKAAKAKLKQHQKNKNKSAQSSNVAAQSSSVNNFSSVSLQEESFNNHDINNITPDVRERSATEPTNNKIENQESTSLQNVSESTQSLPQSIQIQVQSNNHDTVQFLNQKISDLEKAYNNESTQLKTAQAYLQEFQNRLRLQQQSIQDLLTEKTELTNQVSKLTSDLESHRTAASSSANSTNNLSFKFDQIQRELNLVRESKDKFEKASEQLENELDTLNENYRQILSRNEELYERNSELSHQVTVKNGDISIFKKEIDSLESEKLKISKSLKNLQALQTQKDVSDNKKRSSQDTLVQSKIEKLGLESRQYQAQILELGKSVELYKKTVTGLTQERNKLLSQIEKVNLAWQNRMELKEKEFDKKLKERAENSENSSQDLVKNLSEKTENLEKITIFNKTLNEELEKLKTEKQKLESRLESQILDNENLVNSSIETADQLSILQSKSADFQNQLKDRQTLLAQADSDRNTLNRAMTQNKDLKNNLEQITTALINANNDKAQLQMDVDSLAHRLKAVESNSQNFVDKSAQNSPFVSPRSSTTKITNSTEVSENSHQATQDFYEKNQLAEILADEKLHSNQLQEQVDNLTSQLRAYAGKVQELENGRKSEGVSQVGSIYQENEVSQELVSQLAREKLKSASLQEQVFQLQTVVNQTNLNNTSEETKLTHANNVIEHLNIRLQKELASRVELSEKYDELEVANAQLQAQAETINDYITLYREQRAALKQIQQKNALEKEEVDDEKMELRNKLEHLELLVKQLLADRTMTDSSSRGMTENEVITAEKISNVVHDVLDDAGVDIEPLQLSIPYYGPQWDI